MTHVGKIRISEEVSDAISNGSPVVALESTVFSTLGLPEPSNREALQRCISTIHENGAVAAVTAVIDGEARLGLTATNGIEFLAARRK